ncbi:MAG: type II toxin-antitoxin system VapC family toxin [Cyanothece sp. SIO1E1]|nr:type II toxin-antitoxin system VapC family toxin [Cyanothece sp. SIO1E1]
MRPGFVAVVLYNGGRLSSYSSAKLSGLLLRKNGLKFLRMPQLDIKNISTAVNTVIQIRRHLNFIVVPQSAEQFNQALMLYSQRGDKQWSLTDCSSFLLMQALGITDAPAHDKHFELAGFKVLLRKEN